MKVSKGVSVIICCFNSAKRLPATLKHLAQQNVPAHIPWEIVVVNNASTDDTKEVAKYEWDKHFVAGPSFRIVDEPEPGLSFARKKGINESHFEYLVLCDDDNWLDKNYVAEAYTSMEANPSAGAIGGIGTAKCEITPPHWFENFQSYFATGAQGSNSDLIEDITESKRYVYGAGAVIRKKGVQTLVKRRFSSILTDRIGQELVSGGDNELCYALVLIGFRIFYNPRLKFKHFISKERLNDAYFLKLNAGYGYSGILLTPYQFRLSLKNSSSIRTKWQWLLISSLFLLLKHDLFNFIRRGMQPKVSLAARKGAIRSIWVNRKQFKINFRKVSEL